MFILCVSGLHFREGAGGALNLEHGGEEDILTEILLSNAASNNAVQLLLLGRLRSHWHLSRTLLC